MSYRSVVALAAALLTAVAVGCGGGDDSPSADDVPTGAVATVGDVAITSDRLVDQVDALARAQRPAGGSPATGGGDDGDGDAAKVERDQLEAQALSMLLMAEALEQEAADRDIEVSLDDARARWEPIASRQFKTKKALERFLGGQTEADLLAQLRLQVLTERIDDQVSEQAGGGKPGAKAVEQFQKDFQQRWQDKTACSGDYAAPGCD